tara:strand:+ start:1566 stop:1991 length:426 start_codon:yes stop_codon:yes gene_type:complete
MPILQKKSLLRQISRDCIVKARSYRTRHKKLKFRDNAIDIFTSVLVAGSMSLTIMGITFPVLLIPSAVCSSIAFVITQAQRSYNLKHRYNMDAITYTQFEQISREISIVLRKNHLTNDDLIDFLEDINNRIALIEDTAIII